MTSAKAAARRRLRVLALPAFARRRSNPFQAMLYGELEHLNVQVSDWSYLSALWRTADLWHFHHPDTVVFPRARWQSFGETVAMRLLLAWAKLIGIKILWTVHDLDSSDGLHPKLEAWFWRYFIPRLDGCIYLTRFGNQLAAQRFPELREKQSFVITHGDFRPAYTNTVSRAEARARLGLPNEATVLLHFGLIRPYKNVPALIEAFNGWQQPEDGTACILLIVGRVVDRDLEDCIRALAAANSAVRLELAWVPFEDTQLYFNACDLVVLPYRRILNSGTLLLALSFERPALVPDKGVLAEQQVRFGESWIRLYRDDLESEDLAAASAWARDEQRQSPNFTGMSWRDIAVETREAYDTLLAAPMPKATA